MEKRVYSYNATFHVSMLFKSKLDSIRNSNVNFQYSNLNTVDRERTFYVESTFGWHKYLQGYLDALKDTKA